MQGRRATRSEIERICNEFITKYKMFIQQYEICGSYRRGHEDSGDIDLVVMVPKFELMRFGLKLEEDHNVPWNRKVKSMLWDGVQLEVSIVTDEEEMGAMIMHCTGSGGFNARLRRTAAEKGWLLNQYGLWNRSSKVFPIGMRLAGKTEDGIFMVLDAKHTPPQERD